MFYNDGNNDAAAAPDALCSKPISIQEESLFSCSHLLSQHTWVVGMLEEI